MKQETVIPHKRGRPAIHASPAERSAAYRERHNRVTVKLDPETLIALEEYIANSGKSIPKSQAINDLLRKELGIKQGAA